MILEPRTPAWLSWLKPMSLGLDLRGGVHFLFQVDVDGAVEQMLTQSENDFRALLRKERLFYTDVGHQGQEIRIVLPGRRSGGARGRGPDEGQHGVPSSERTEAVRPVLDRAPHRCGRQGAPGLRDRPEPDDAAQPRRRAGRRRAYRPASGSQPHRRRAAGRAGSGARRARARRRGDARVPPRRYRARPGRSAAHGPRAARHATLQGSPRQARAAQARPHRLRRAAHRRAVAAIDRGSARGQREPRLQGRPAHARDHAREPQQADGGALHRAEADDRRRATASRSRRPAPRSASSASRRSAASSATASRSPASSSRRRTSWRCSCARARSPRRSSKVEERTIGPSLGADNINAGDACLRLGLRRARDLHGLLLPHLRRDRGHRARDERHHADRAALDLPGDALAARHRRHPAHRRHLGRRERAHQRAHPRGAAQRQHAAGAPSTRATTRPSQRSSTRTSRRSSPRSRSACSAPAPCAASPSCSGSAS